MHMIKERHTSYVPIVNLGHMNKKVLWPVLWDMEVMYILCGVHIPK